MFREHLPLRWGNQRRQADKLDPRFLVSDTVFTTLTVNHNWRTACHRDAGDLHEGFSNICGITGPEGKGWKGAEFLLPEYRIAIDLHNTDILFVDVHKWHGNTPFLETSPDYLRIAFVMYYREYMYKCKSPKEELFNIKMNQTGFLKL